MEPAPDSISPDEFSELVQGTRDPKAHNMKGPTTWYNCTHTPAPKLESILLTPGSQCPLVLLSDMPPPLHPP